MSTSGAPVRRSRTPLFNVSQNERRDAPVRRGRSFSLPARLLPVSDDLVNQAVLFGLHRRHAAVALNVALDLLEGLARVLGHDDRRSCAMMRLATVSSIGVPKKTMLSRSSRE